MNWYPSRSCDELGESAWGKRKALASVQWAAMRKHDQLILEVEKVLIVRIDDLTQRLVVV